MAATVETRRGENAFATKVGPLDGTLTAVKRVLRYAVMLPGLLYLWALLPVSFRPQYTGSPLRKPDATVNVDISAAGAAGISTQTVAAAGAGLVKLSNSRLKQACEPPGLLKPIVRPAQQVVVRYLENGHVVAEKRYDCTAYV
jgi:hypothetical protein